MENNVNQIELKFQRFFISNFPKVKNYAQLLLKSEVDAEDVAQDIFCKLWLQPEIWLDNENELDNYLFIMTRNIILNIFKHQQIEREYQEGYLEKTVLHELIEGEDALNNIYYEEMLLVVRLTLEKMPERRRLIFELSRFKGLSYKEIAEKLNVSMRKKKKKHFTRCGNKRENRKYLAECNSPYYGCNKIWECSLSVPVKSISYLYGEQQLFSCWQYHLFLSI